jgi:hypothetical protein
VQGIVIKVKLDSFYAKIEMNYKYNGHRL